MSVAFQDTNHSATVPSRWQAFVASASRMKWTAAMFVAGIVVLGSLIYFFTQVKRNDLAFYGVVESQEIRLASKVGGRIAEVLVQEGDFVEAGACLVRFEAPELEAEKRLCQAQLRSFEARLLQARNGALPEQIESVAASLEIANAQLADLEAGSRTQEIEQARLDVDVMQAEATRAATEFERLKHLYTGRIISASEYDSGRTLMQSANGKLEMARQRLSQLQSGTRKDTIAQAKATVRKMQAELDHIQRGTREEEIQQLVAQVEEAQARLELLETRLAETVVVAPSACLVEVLTVRTGQILSPNEPVVKVRCPEDQWVKAFVPETELHRFQLNASVNLRRDNDSTDYSGKVVYISSVSEFTPRNIQSINERQHQVFAIKVKPQADRNVFKSGMAARVLMPQTRPTRIGENTVPHGLPISSDGRRFHRREPDEAW